MIRARTAALGLALASTLVLAWLGSPAITSPAPAPRPAPPPAPTFSGIDAVFVIDDSGSMHGGRVTQANDRDARRVEAAWAAVGRLFHDAQGSTRLHRVSVIEFGNDASTVIHALPIVNDPTQPDGRTTLGYVQARVRARNLGDTDHLKALRLARDELRSMAADTNVPPGPRLQRIVLVTDGKPDAPEPPYGSRQPRVFNEGRYVADLREFINQQLPPGVLWVFGLHDTNDPQYWTAWGPYWERLTGIEPGAGGRGPQPRTRKIDRQEDIRGRMRDVVAAWLGTSAPPPAADTYLCPPYLKAVLFDIELEQPRDFAAVSIADPDGQVVPHSQFVLFQGGRSLQLRVDTPKPGLWRLRNQGVKSYRVSPEPLYRDITLTEPTTPQSRGASVRFHHAVRDSDGNLFRFDRTWPLDVAVIVRGPDGSEATLPARGVAGSPGEFHTVAPYTTAVKGDYAVGFRGTVKMADAAAAKTDVTVFEKVGPQADRMTVTDRLALELVLEQPQVGGTARLRWGRGELLVRGRVARGDARGTPPPLDSVVANPSGLLSGRLYDQRTGGPIGPARPFVQRGQALEAVFPLEQRMLTLDWLLHRGQVFVRIEADQSAMRSEYALQSVHQAATGAPAARAGAMDTHPVAVAEHPFTFGAFALLIVLLLLGLGWVLWQGSRRLAYRLSDRGLAPVLRLSNFYHPECRLDLDVAGRPAVDYAGRTVPLHDGTVWTIRHMRIRRLRAPAGEVKLRVEYLPYRDRDGVELRKPEPGTIRRFTLDSLPGSREIVEGLDSRDYYFELRTATNAGGAS